MSATSNPTRSPTKFPTKSPSSTKSPFQTASPASTRRPTAQPASVSNAVKLCPMHVNLDATLAHGAAPYSFPSNHPKVQPLLKPFMPSDHPDVDSLLRSGKHFPSEHPTIDKYTVQDPDSCAFFTSTQSFCLTVPNGHPNVDDALLNGEKLPSGHPKVDPLFRPYLPDGHPNCDDLISSGTPLPIGHPPINSFLCQTSSWSAGLIMTILVSGIFVIVLAFKVGYYQYKNFSNKKVMGSKTVERTEFRETNGVQLQDLPTAQVVKNLDPNPMHGSTRPVAAAASVAKPMAAQSSTASKPMAAQSSAVVAKEVEVDNWKAVTDESSGKFYWWNTETGETTEVGAPKPKAKKSKPKATKSNWTAVIDESSGQTYWWNKETGETTELGAPKPASNEPEVNVSDVDSKSESEPDYWKAVTDESSGKVYWWNTETGETTEVGAPKPKAKKSKPKATKSNWTAVIDESSGQTYWWNKETGETTELGAPKPASDSSSAPSELFQAIQSTTYTDPNNKLGRRDLTRHDIENLHAAHKTQLYDYGKYSNVIVPEVNGEVTVPVEAIDHMSEGARRRLSRRLGVDVDSANEKVKMQPLISKKTNTLYSRLKNVVTHYRIPYVHWELSNVLIFIAYLCMNLFCLYIAPVKEYGRSWGSLAAFNAFLLVIPATRNNILTFTMGLPFDHVVVYHRFFGRFTIMCVIIHFFYFVKAYTITPYPYYTGLGAMICGLIIFGTSMDYIRRNYFNAFYWSHYSFVGFFILAYFHVPQTQGFILAAAAIYVGDKVLRHVWMLWPRTMTTFVNKGDAIAHVRFKKNPLTRWFGMHRVGQYYFVNFPALSLHEWHPFSVSSGPREREVELHIRALGDHTKEIVKLATERGKTNAPTWICIDGPYGIQNFNYRRYPMMLLAGGGIGVTPVMCMLKDIYDIGLPANEQNVLPHAIETVYFMWVMPNLADYESFRSDLELCSQRSQEPGRPKLVSMIYVTRSKDKLEPPFISGRPKVTEIFSTMMSAHPDDAGLVFACGPSPMVAELWDNSIQSTLKGRRIDFHHEIFEF